MMFIKTLKQGFRASQIMLIKEESGLGLQYIRRIREALENKDICTMSGLSSVKGIGEVTLEKSFRYIRNHDKFPSNLELF